jgi:hypothetical protein
VKLGRPQAAGAIGHDVQSAGALDPRLLSGAALERGAPFDHAIVAAPRPTLGNLPRALSLLDGCAPTLLGDGALTLG